MSEQIRNKVAESGIITIVPETFIPSGERVAYDIKPILFMEQILREKDLRDHIKATDWKQFEGKYVALYCSADAIVPTWAYMLLTLALQPYAKTVVHGDLSKLEEELIENSLMHFSASDYAGARIVIKGCGDKHVPVNVYVRLSALLKPYAKSIMYGEPCSTVPLYKASS